MSYVAPSGAVVRFCCDPPAAARLSSLGLAVFEVADGAPVIEYPCPVDSDVFINAAARTEVTAADGVLVADLSKGATVLEDSNPSRREYLDYQGRPSGWWPPKLNQKALTPVRLPSRFTVDGLPGLLVRWMQQVPELEPGAYEEALRAWKDRLLELERLAQQRADSVRGLANDDERLQLDRALSDIRRVILYGTNFELDLTPDGEGGAWVPHEAVVVNDDLAKIYGLAEQLEKAQADRERREAYQEEIERLVTKWRYNLSERLQMAVDAGMLSQSTGIARAELLALLRPGWDWAEGEVKEAVNPTEEALRTLLAAQGQMDANARLGYVSTGRREGHFVVVSEFLGRPIVGELDKVQLEVPLED